MSCTVGTTGRLLLAALLIGLAPGCGGEPAPGGAPELGGSVTSTGGRYRIEFRPAIAKPAVGEMHDWVLRIERTDGAPAQPTTIAFDGGMPAHGHGFATAPRVTRELGDAEYLVEGVRFHMPGDWELRAVVTDATGRDGAALAALAGLLALAAACGPSPEPRAPNTQAEPAEPTTTEWSTSELALLRSLSVDALPPAPRQPSNRFADAPGAADLGHHLFFDPGLSRDGSISCASCHEPARLFTDGRVTSRGLAETSRNAPTLVGAAHSPWQFWDGRRDSLWAQALAPLEAAAEMGSTRVAVVRYVAGEPSLAKRYADVFGSAPTPSDLARWPERAGPFGAPDERAAWQRMPARDRHAVDRAFANVGKAIAAYERQLRPGRSRFDRYVASLGTGGGEAELTDEEIRGLRLFVDAGRSLCLRCHNGPLLTNQTFHDVATGGAADFGRFVGIQAVLIDPFNCLGAHSDARPAECRELRFLDRTHVGGEVGKFKTPTLRGLSRTGPYMHDGRFATLSEVVEHYRRPPPAPGSELTPLEIDEAGSRALVAFLSSLDGGLAVDEARLRPPSPPAARRSPSD
ncbi:MAG: cytochrome c peroxidase [Myxococcota bacterium]